MNTSDRAVLQGVSPLIRRASWRFSVIAWIAGAFLLVVMSNRPIDRWAPQDWLGLVFITLPATLVLVYISYQESVRALLHDLESAQATGVAPRFSGESRLDIDDSWLRLTNREVRRSIHRAWWRFAVVMFGAGGVMSVTVFCLSCLVIDDPLVVGAFVTACFAAAMFHRYARSVRGLLADLHGIQHVVSAEGASRRS